MASTLPTELTQLILHHLDPESYLSAHQTCRSWRHASSSPYMLHHILQQIPASPVPPTDSLTAGQWAAYFAQTARRNLLGRRHCVRKSVAPRLAPEGGAAGSMVLGASEDGKTVVGLRGAQVLVYRAEAAGMGFAPGDCLASEVDSDSEPEPTAQPELNPEPNSTFSLASSLYPHWTSVCRALMDHSNAGCFGVNARHSKHRLAVSSSGDFVAVALGRVVQIYGLRSSSSLQLESADSQKIPAEHVLGQARGTSHGVFSRAPDQGQGQNPHTHPHAQPDRHAHAQLSYEDTDGVVEGLEFVENDTLLRVAIGKESTIHRPTRVRYLGCPDLAAVFADGVDLNYWRQAISMIYLDSAAMGAALSATAAARGIGIGRETRCQLRGLRLLDKRDWRYQSRQTRCSADTPDEERYFVASLQTGDVDTYCVGLATSRPSASGSGSISVTLHHLIPIIYSLPGPLPTTQSKDFPSSCLYSYPHASVSDTSSSSSSQSGSPTPANTDTDTDKDQRTPPTNPKTNPTSISTSSSSYNLQTTLPRFTSPNLPSGTFSAPLLAVSSDGAILAIYEPDHACCVVEGGALYICYVGRGESGYQLGQKFASGSGTGSECGRVVDGDSESESEGESDGEGIYRGRDTPTWPFLLDRVNVDVERIAVRGRGGKYVVTGVAGEEVMEWVF